MKTKHTINHDEAVSQIQARLQEADFVALDGQKLLVRGEQVGLVQRVEITYDDDGNNVVNFVVGLPDKKQMTVSRRAGNVMMQALLPL